MWEGRDAIVRDFGKPDSSDDNALLPVRAFALLSDIDKFDRHLFRITAREATVMDPQHRLWLETVWHALEDAGLGDRPELNIGVHAACNRSAYLDNNLRADSALAERLRIHSSSESRQILNANDKEFLPLRTSYALGLSGPSVNVQTACSSALVAVSLACRALQDGDADVYIAGGASITRTTTETQFAESGAIHSPSGFCRPFDATADGTVFGDGVGAVVLRRLQDAEADGDRIYAVIKGWALSNDGSQKSSFLAPSAKAQAAAIRKAHAMAEFSAASIGFVECHATATRVGDPIEFEALRQALGDTKEPCLIGSVKSNVGHLDTAAGVAGLIKTALMLHRQSFLPTAGFEIPNPLLKIDQTRFRISERAKPWVQHAPRRAGVTALGVGGTNCHLALEQAPVLVSEQADAGSWRPALLLASGETPGAASRHLRAHRHCLVDESVAVGAHCNATATRRRHLTFRHALVADSRDELLAKLDTSPAPPPIDSRKRRMAFVFNGQLSSYAGMCKELFAAEPVFRRWLLKCEGILESLLDKKLTTLLFSDSEDLALTRYEQPVMCAVQISLFETWNEWKLRPYAVIGYSVGEFSAAYAAGAISLLDVLTLVSARGRLMEGIEAHGSMVAVRTGALSLEAILNSKVSYELTASLGECSCVVATPQASLALLKQHLEASGVSCRVLTERYGFHSAWVEPCLAQLALAVQSATWRSPRCAFISCIDGARKSSHLGDAEYWMEQARAPVRFDEAVLTATESGCTLFLEVGPGRMLRDIGEQLNSSVVWVNTLEPGVPDSTSMKRGLRDLYLAGENPDWRGVFSVQEHCRASLPQYAFERESYWTGATPAAARANDTTSIVINAVWKVNDEDHLQDHKLFGRIVVPASHQIAWILDRVRSELSADAFVIDDWVFLRPVLIPDGGEVAITLTLGPASHDGVGLTYAVEATAEKTDAGAPVPFLNAKLCLHDQFELPAVVVENELVFNQSNGAVDGATFYAQTWVQGRNTGPSFRKIAALYSSEGTATAKLLPRATSAAIAVASAEIEAGFQTLYAATTIETRKDLEVLRRTWVPYAIDRICYRHPSASGITWTRATHSSDASSPDSVAGAVSLFTDNGACIFDATGFQLRPLREQVLAEAELGSDVFEIALDPIANLPPSPNRSLPTLVVSAGPLSRDCAKACLSQLRCSHYIDASTGDVAKSVLSAMQDAKSQSLPLQILFLHFGGSETSLSYQQFSAGVTAIFDVIRTLESGNPDLAQFIVATLNDGGHAMLDSSGTEGITRVMMNELGQWPIKLVSVSHRADVSTQSGALLAELGSDDVGEQLIYVGAMRHRRTLKALQTGPQTAMLKADRSYLVIGPDNGQAEIVARWLTDNGAGAVTLAIADVDDEALRSIKAGEKVTIVALNDVAENVPRFLPSDTMPVAGVFFIPWTMDNAALAMQSDERMARAIQPAFDLLQQLASASNDLALDQFVCFSSSAAVLGTQGQASYASLTSFFDALCNQRADRGLAGTSINWPPWEEIGHWQNDRKSADQTLRQGWTPLATPHAMSLLSSITAMRPGQAAILPLDWKMLLQYNDQQGIALVKRKAGVAAAPLTDVNAQAFDPVGMLAELLGEHPDVLEDTAVLGDLGLDSLMAVRLRNSLRASCKVDIALAALLSKTTVADLRNVGHRRTVEPATDAVRSQGQAAIEQFANVDGTRTLFCLHWIVSYRELAEALAKENSLSVIWIEDDSDYATLQTNTVEKLAARYIQRLRETQAHGPYRLLGSSFAGLIAYEMAQQLRGSGEEIELLVLVDTNAPDIVRSRRSLIRRAALRTIFGIRNRGRKFVENKGWRYPLDLYKRRGIKHIATESVVRLQKAFMPRPAVSRSLAFRAAALQSYRPKTYDGAVLLCVASRNSMHYWRPADLGWSRHVSGGLTLHSIEGRHDFVSDPQGARQLAAILRPYLE